MTVPRVTRRRDYAAAANRALAVLHGQVEDIRSNLRDHDLSDAVLVDRIRRILNEPKAKA